MKQIIGFIGPRKIGIFISLQQAFHGVNFSHFKKMTRIRTLRRAYYNLFSHLYDAFINLHARRDAGEFVKGGMEPFQRIFSAVTLFHSPSGKSKLFVCRR